MCSIPFVETFVVAVIDHQTVGKHIGAETNEEQCQKGHGHDAGGGSGEEGLLQLGIHNHEKLLGAYRD